MRKIALVTGATAGIGEATAILLAKQNFDLILTGRRKERLEILRDKIIQENKINVCLLNFDIRNNEEVEDAIDNLPEKWKNIDILINNAGLAAGLSRIQDGDLLDWEVMIDTNIKGLLYISKKIMPLMIKNKSGHIVNIGSIAGKEVYLNGNVYCATKHAVDALTKSMRIDLLPYRIKVTGINPGMVETEFSIVRLKDKEKAKQVYKDMIPLSAEDIADTIIYAITRPAHVTLNDIVIMPTAQANTSNLIRN